MSKGKAIFLAGIALFLVIAVLWSRQGGFAYIYQEGNTKEWAELPAQFISSSRCQACHPVAYSAWVASEHKSVDCQSCHGPALEHIQAGKLLPVTSTELCGLCHSKAIGRRADFPQVDSMEHAGQLACVTCHQPHAPGLAGSGGQ